NVTNPRCAFWNFTGADGIGNWSIDGCTTVVDPNDLSSVTCYCDHLAKFALLVDISTRTGNGTSPPFGVRVGLEVITYVGVCVSLVGLILTILTLLVFKKLRKKDSSKFHIQLCLSLCFVLIIFITGVSRTSVRPLCISIGALIHYFTLVFWMWMGAEAVLMFQKIVIVFTNITWRYILIVSIVCWSVPLIPVAVLSGIDYNYYITLNMNSEFEYRRQWTAIFCPSQKRTYSTTTPKAHKYNTYITTSQANGAALAIENATFDNKEGTMNTSICFIGKTIPLLAAFLLPIFLIIINTIVFILVIQTTLKNATDRKKQMSNSSLSVSEVLKMLLSFTGIMILFGLTWISAAFTFISEPSEYRKPWKARFVQCFPRTTIHSDYKSGPSNKGTKR
uniref:GPS domain-containing protein n=1 Tax=Amphimedon queenslandica TaxID=400682 RepID=A0A1X7SYH4_AMPQE